MLETHLEILSNKVELLGYVALTCKQQSDEAFVHTIQHTIEVIYDDLVDHLADLRLHIRSQSNINQANKIFDEIMPKSKVQ